MKGENNLEISPESVAIITTYRCTAQCKDCCFDCSPKETAVLSLEMIKEFIDEVSKFDSIISVIWTGGECSILGKDLLRGIAYAKTKGLTSRIVTNASWSRGLDENKKYLSKLKENGLVEINVSTGDNHQQFVNIDKVMSVIQAAVSVGLKSLIFVEKTKFSTFTIENLKEMPQYKEIKDSGKENLLSLLVAPWVSFGSENHYDYDEEAFIEKRKGCNSLFTTIALNPENEVLSCCGLTVRYIPEMTLGNLRDSSVFEMYDKQRSDFIKQWLFVEGPVNILHQVKEWDDTIEIPKFVHPCQACAYIFQTPEIMSVITENYTKILERVTRKFYQKVNFKPTFEKKLKTLSKSMKNT